MVTARIFETGLQKLARIIARQYKIDVIFEGTQAYTDGKKIVLPSTAELSPELMKDLNGYLDHEVAHCKFTEFSETKRVISEFHMKLLNAVEDVRIEREIIKELPGCAKNLAPLNEKLLGKLFTQWGELPLPVRIIVLISLVMSGEKTPDDAEAKMYLAKITPELAKLNTCKTTGELRVVTEEITRKLKDLFSEEKKKEEKAKDGKKSDEKKGEKKDGKGKGKSEKSDEKSEDEKSEGEKSDEKSESEKTASMMSDKPGEDSTGEWSESDTSVDDMINREIKQEIGEHKEEIKKGSRRTSRGDSSRTVANNSHTPFSTRFDREINHVGTGNREEYRSAYAKVKDLVAPIRREFERVLKVMENARWVGEKDRGMIDSRNLFRLQTDRSFRRPFKERTKVETNNVAIEILVDLSGSMEGSKIATARMSVIALAEALKELNFQFEITGFTSNYDRKLSAIANEAHAAGTDFTTFNRVQQALEKHIFKPFGEMDLTGLTMIRAKADNPDGEAVRWAAGRLSQQKQKRKILMVLSDGMPQTSEADTRLLDIDLRKAVKEVEKFGIETIGIGIQTDAVTQYYKNNAVVHNYRDLPQVVMTKIAQIITKGGAK